MSQLKRYFVVFLVLMILCGIRFAEFGENTESIESFRGAALLEEDFNPLIASSVNEKQVKLKIDNKEYNNDTSSIYMNDDLSLMVPISLLSEGLNCSVQLYDQRELFVEKRNDVIVSDLNSDLIQVNGSPVAVNTPMIKKDNEYFVSLEDISEHIGYSYSWDIEENQAVAVDEDAGDSILPSSYDLRQRGRVGTVKDQGLTGTCWAFAALTALESDSRPELSDSFSVDHMFRQNSFAVNETDGGEYTMGMAYLLSWKGPVLDVDDPFGDGASDGSLEAVQHVQEVQMIEGKNYEKIKEAVFKYGGVDTALYSALDGGEGESGFYNEQNQAYCYLGTEKPNHEVVIVGWDDNYPKENFSVNVQGDGAFICQNSWGDGFGDEGFFYVSYYDTNIGSHNVVYTRVDDTDNYDKIYQADLCGWVGQIGFGKSSVYAANTYVAEDKEQIRAAGFYATGANTEYELYIVKNFTGVDSLVSKRKIAAGTLTNAGYYTIDFDTPVNVEEGEKYAIILYINTPDSEHPLAIEYVADEATATVDITDGEGYVSATGLAWDSIETKSSANICLKVYADVLE